MGSDLLTFPPSTESAELAAARARVADLEIRLADTTRERDVAAVRAERWRTEIEAAIESRIDNRIEINMNGGLDPDVGWRLAAHLLTEGGPFRTDIAGALGIDPWVHLESGVNRSWESIVEAVKALHRRASANAELPVARAQSRAELAEMDLKAVRETMSEMAKILGCGREVPQVFDAITRLKERNATLTSETASQLATEKAAHRATIIGMEKYGKTPAEVLGAVARMEQEVERLRANAGATLAQLEGFIMNAVATGTDGRFDPVFGHSAIRVVEDLAKDWLAKSYQLGALDADDDDDDDPDPDDRDSSAFAVVSLQTVIAVAERDWASTPGDAWIYGVVIGWDAASLTDLAARFGWKQATLDHLAALHEALVGAETEER